MKHLYKDIAFVIGNGESRKDFDLKSLRGVAPVYGCNALYRDFPDFSFPDYLISMDEKIGGEIKRSDFPRHRHLEVTGREIYEMNTGRKNNAGMIAMQKAIKHGAKTIIALGIDFIINDELETSNLYEGTHGYGMDTRATKQDNTNRLEYLEWFCNKYKHVHFKFVFPDTVTDFKNLTAENIEGLRYSELIDFLQE